MYDTKQILRVILKLMSAAALLWLAYIFVAGLFDRPGSEIKNLLSFDLTPEMKAGEVRFFQAGRRKLLVAYDKEYYVGWADDPTYGCAIEYRQDERRLKSVCVESWFDLQGHVMAGSKTEVDLKSPAYQISEGRKLVLQQE